MSINAVHQATEQARTGQLPLLAPQNPVKPNPVISGPNQAAFAHPQQIPNSKLPEPTQLEACLDDIPPAALRKLAALVPKPMALGNASALAGLDNQQLVVTLMRGENGSGVYRYSNINRNAAQLETSGVLNDLRLLAQREIQVPASEYDRSISDDAVLVMQGFAQMSADQIANCKEKAYQHPEFASDHQASIDKRYFGSAQHMEFGALVEQLSGGVISAEEAMAMSPCGGIPGAGPKEVPLISKIDAIQRHAMRHDALGFLLTRFDVGPGYGSKTTVFGLESHKPMAGQVLGVAREVFREASVMPASEHVARPERFNA
ncbi:MAG: hypothetical protein CVV27_12310 [Candidatus Melainabacteria bacterium HGW-Melainabacteria-1]|nr:MAG: hypothetical protein CVV27_12310 [Candidatus Melainabacteria bacterium HGW-Melainabacteria-1]